jgi:hypothetical protein
MKQAIAVRKECYRSNNKSAQNTADEYDNRRHVTTLPVVGERKTVVKPRSLPKHNLMEEVWIVLSSAAIHLLQGWAAVMWRES